MVRAGLRCFCRALLLLLPLALASFLIQPAGGNEPSQTLAGHWEHECHLFGFTFAAGAGDEELLATLCADLYGKTLPGGRRESPSRDGWGFGHFLAPPHPGIARPILLKAGPPACEDDARWNAAIDEIATFSLPGPAAVIGHVRKSSYGPDFGALPNPHPFADSLSSRWWLFAHNGHMRPDTLMPWIPQAFMERHPLDYDEVVVDSEVFFRYCLYEIGQHGSVRDGLLYAFHRIKEYDDFVFNICFTAGDTLWAAHSVSYTPFYYAAVSDSAAWWASTVRGESSPDSMEMHHLYWFAPGGMGCASYE
jgi:predicted glutamine amidotransferase